jgi:hypothetical protein
MRVLEHTARQEPRKRIKLAEFHRFWSLSIQEKAPGRIGKTPATSSDGTELYRCGAGAGIHAVYRTEGRGSGHPPSQTPSAFVCFHLANIVFAMVGGLGEILLAQAMAALPQTGILALVWSRRRAVAS